MLVPMQSVVNVTCRGTAQRGHPKRTVAQFRDNDGWARVHPRGIDRGRRDPILWLPATPSAPHGEIRMLHVVHCQACDRTFPPLTPERLYPLLDWAREHDKDVPLG